MDKNNKTFYELAKKYYEHHGNLRMHRLFQTINGYEYSENGVPLGTWINNQLDLFRQGKLSDEMIRGLKAIGMFFEIDNKKTKEKISEEQWERMYKLATKYYEQHWHLDIDYDFRTRYGPEYSEDGLSLGMWIDSQLEHFKQGELSEEKHQKLETIEFDFNAKTNQEKIMDICIANGIDYELNKHLLTRVPAKELEAKVAWLQSDNGSLVDNNGGLQPILYMHRLAVKKDYGINTDELIEKYCNADEKLTK